jgi:hypothetical protein
LRTVSEPTVRSITEITNEKKIRIKKLSGESNSNGNGKRVGCQITEFLFSDKVSTLCPAFRSLCT